MTPRIDFIFYGTFNFLEHPTVQALHCIVINRLLLELFYKNTQNIIDEGRLHRFKQCTGVLHCIILFPTNILNYCIWGKASKEVQLFQIYDQFRTANGRFINKNLITVYKINQVSKKQGGPKKSKKS